jgi:hypothetical protein
MLSPKFEWTDFFTGTPETTLNSSQCSSKQTLSTSSVYVFNCLFDKCTITGGNGGALLCTSVTYFFVESSSFFSCKTSSGQGGAIYLSSSNCLQSVLYAVCGNDCFATSYGPFAFLIINNAASNKNYVNYTSIARCVGYTSNHGETMRFDYGRTYCPSVNMSNNNFYCIPGIVSTPTVDPSSVTSLFSYSTFADNRASQFSCLWCNRGGAKYEMKYCNILRNTQASSSYGIIFARGNLMIEDSCILENRAPTYIIYQEDTSYTITLSNCTIDSTSKYGNVITQNTAIKSFIHGLKHISTQNCHAQFDSAGTLTAIPYVSHPTKKVFCHTCKNIAQISDFFTFHCMFIFTFLHSTPSVQFCYDFDRFCI